VKLIVGLGNPGEQYERTPHNLGFLVIDRLAADLNVEVRNRQCRALTARTIIGNEPVVLAKPETFMNRSGVSVRDLVEKLEIRPETDLVVIQDELDLSFGTLKIHKARSSAGHNGIESIIDSLGTKDFLRIRIGAAPEHQIADGKDYLLSPMSKAQQKVLDAILIDAVDAAKMIVIDGPAVAMQRFNRRSPEEENA
jgi:peptidyl-tRNA hydrolase, PTH1 family